MGNNYNILIVNAGSSSIKLDLFFADNNDHSYKFLSASITNIGLPNAKLIYQRESDELNTQNLIINDLPSAVYALINWLQEINALTDITAVGHRIVHSGPKYSKPVVITEQFVNYLESNINLDPEHIPVEVLIIKELKKLLPNTAQVACFDSAYFFDMPKVAKLLSLPKKYQNLGLKRYGFHGLSYSYLDKIFREIAGDVAGNGRVIYAHLGSGASLTAVHHGQPIDTTMSFTPASGIMMSTRSGDIDPGLSWYLQNQLGISNEDYNHMINHESGLLGVSELSADMYTLLQNEPNNESASDAINLFVYQVKKAIGSLTAVLGGLDSLIFSGGIGEKSAPIRNRICEGLEYLGIRIDVDLNYQNASLISVNHSQVGVHVIPTDESRVICSQVIDIINTNKGRA
jgi:acetate kinase